jgi:hypothetical protein
VQGCAEGSVVSAANLPWTITEARDALAAASRAQHDHQAAIRDAVSAAGKAEQLYRVARARKTAEARDDGKAATLCDTLARGDEEVAQAAHDAAVAEGDREIAVQEGWRLSRSRHDLQSLAEWSMRRDLAEGYGDGAPEPEQMQTYGRRPT